MKFSVVVFTIFCFLGTAVYRGESILIKKENQRSGFYPQYGHVLERLRSSYGFKDNDPLILVSISQQMLYLVKNKTIIRSYPVSTSKFGVGSQYGSNKTPLGIHRICSKIGAHAPVGTVFVCGINTGKIVKIYLEDSDSEEDAITTRILWLEGLENGINKGRGIDSYSRRIYIHGTPEEGLIGEPSSHGCVRMKNNDIVELFNMVEKGTLLVLQRE